jgi:hypothetical protein
MTRDEARAELTRRGIDWKTGKKIQPSVDWKGTIKQGIRSSVQKPFSAAYDLGTNPVSMANAMPPALSAAGGLSPVPGGATMGMAVGQGIRDLSLKAMGKPIPGMMQHGLELGGSALGDIAAIPAMKGAYFGKQIGDAERAAGVITNAPEKAVTPGSVGKTLNEIEPRLDDMMRAQTKGLALAQPAKDAKAIVSQIYKNPRIYEQTPEISVQAARVSKKAQQALNQAIQGRAAPSDAMARAMTIPNMIRNRWNALPWPVKRGIQGYLGIEAVRKLLGE